MKMPAAFAFLALILLAPALAWAQPGRSAPVATDHVTTRIWAESPVAQPGQRLWLLVDQQIKEGWHTYWSNTGDSGIPTTVEWIYPPGVTAGAIEWPAPERHPFGDIMNYGFAGRMGFLIPLDVAADVAEGPVSLEAKIAWLVCADVCIPEEASLSLPLTIAARSVAPDAEAAPLFAATRARLPMPWPGGRFAFGPQTFVLDLPKPPPGTGEPYFFPADWGVLDHGARQSISGDQGGLRLTVARAPKSPDLKAAPGVLVMGDKAYALSPVLDPALPVPATPPAPAAAANPESFADIGLWQAVLFALLGGLILNLMPCVLPVLSMKALALASHAHGPRRDQLGQGLAYMAGVLASFGGFAGVLLALRAGGESLGWGFQLQSPGLIMALALLMVACGFNFLGLLPVPSALAGAGQSLAGKGGLAGSFFTGVLASLVASPCTAPFMGAATGWALVAPPVQAMAVFLGLGFGFGLPFLLLAFSPGLMARLPRPGPWMVRFKEILAFPMFGTAIWLTWVATIQIGAPAPVAILSATLAIGAAAWASGLAPGRWATGFILLCWAGAVAALIWGARVPSAASQAASAAGHWAPYSPAAVADGLAAGRPVFVNLTAAWCVTCLVNERVALETAEVQKAVKAKNILLLKGDWTARDPVITETLKSFGRAGVPLYLLYKPGVGAPAAAPEILPQILTPGLVTAAFGRLP